MLDLSQDNFLTLDEVKQRASSIFSKTAAPTVSDKFTHIPTFKVIEDMEKLGWGVVDAKQVRARKGDGRINLHHAQNEASATELLVNDRGSEHAIINILMPSNMYVF